MDALLAITLAAQGVLFLFTAVSFVAPARRIWPPPALHSGQVYATGLLSWVLATPFVEEPWLAERHGAEYATYRREVPRFIGLRGLRETL